MGTTPEEKLYKSFDFTYGESLARIYYSWLMDGTSHDVYSKKNCEIYKSRNAKIHNSITIMFPLSHKQTDNEPQRYECARGSKGSEDFDFFFVRHLIRVETLTFANSSSIAAKIIVIVQKTSIRHHLS